MIPDYFTTEPGGTPRTRLKVAIDDSILAATARLPALRTGGEDRMLHREDESSVGCERLVDIRTYGSEILDIMQD